MNIKDCFNLESQISCSYWFHYYNWLKLWKAVIKYWQIMGSTGSRQLSHIYKWTMSWYLNTMNLKARYEIIIDIIYEHAKNTISQI